MSVSPARADHDHVCAHAGDALDRSVDAATVDIAVDTTVDAVHEHRPSVPLRLVIWYQRNFAGGTPTCRFFPSCSSYAREALEVHGTWRGMWLAARRLSRCRPFGPYGVDPVPEPRSAHRSSSPKVD